MSEKEIIQNTKDFIEDLKTDLDGNDGSGIKWTLYNRDLTTFEGLLYLYKQEKEKNKELEKYKTYYEEMEEVNKKFIAVDKIKEKIEEVQARMGNDCIALHDFQREAKIDVLNELLEEK